jgi:Na+-transporting methylmalonyl-CoA/oxaloacetate decarboxylase gamma subunit
VGDLGEGLAVSVLALAAIFVFFGILYGCVRFVSRRAARRAGGIRAQPPLREREAETVALFSALYASLPRMVEGEYVVWLGAEKRILRIRKWSSGRGIVETAGRSLEVRIRGDDGASSAPSGRASEPGPESRTDSEG